MRKVFRRLLKKDRYTSRFTLNCRKAMIYSSETAEANTHAYVEPLHLLIGLTSEQTSLSAQVLRNHGIHEEDLLALLKDTGFKIRLPNTKIQIASDVEKIVQQAVNESMKMKMPQINTGHLLLAISRVENSYIQQVFDQAKVEIGSVQHEISERLSEQASK